MQKGFRVKGLGVIYSVVSEFDAKETNIYANVLWVASSIYLFGWCNDEM